MSCANFLGPIIGQIIGFGGVVVFINWNENRRDRNEKRKFK